MSGREKPLILQNGMPIPQAYDKDLGDWTEYSTEHIKAIKAELALVKAELQTIKANQLSGDQKVQLSGTIVSTPALGPMEVAAGARVLVFEDDSGLFSKAMFLIYVSAGPASGKLYERYSVGPHTSVALESEIPLINRNARLFTEQPHPLLSPHRVRIYWENTTTNTQTISRFATWFYGR